tara:strand:+ start:5484 stop:6113 length:630 start_codon:yes stop_codon:yes gene_type:complete
MEDIKNEIIKKAGFPLYRDYWEKYFCKMTGEQTKEVLKIIFHFNATYEVLPTIDLAIDMVVATIIDNLKRDAGKRIRSSKASSENGKLGGRPPKGKAKQKKSKVAINESQEEEFEKFWILYNHKKSKGLAVKSFEKALKVDSLDNILAGLTKYVNTRGRESQFWKHPSAWLNQECWNDEYTPSQGKPKQIHNNFGDQDFNHKIEGFEYD